MNYIEVTEVSTGSIVLKKNIYRVNNFDNRMGIMLEGGFDPKAHALKKSTLYKISIYPGSNDPQEAIINAEGYIENAPLNINNIMCTFINYNFASGINEQGVMVTYDNTILFEPLN